MIERPSFDEYFLTIAFVVSIRSEDKHIKHGSVIVSNASKHIIGTGYNATIRGSDKSQIDLENREERRAWMIHSEENAIMNCTKNPLDLPGGATIYITGLPCINCLQRIINFGINRICMADRMGSITENDKTKEMREKLVKMSGIQIDLISLRTPFQILSEVTNSLNCR